MKRSLVAAASLLSLAVAVQPAAALQPYVQVETGVLARDVVEEDPSIQGFTHEGRATSTRVLATAGFAFNDVVTVFAQGGGADLTIGEFNDFDSSFEGAYGGGVRVNLFVSPYRDRLRVFAEGSVLRTAAEDTVRAEFGCTAANGCIAAPQGGRQGYYPRFVEERIEWTEYTVLLGAASRYGAFGPYGGVRLSKVDATDKLRAAPDANFATAFEADADLAEQDSFGIFCGTDFFLDPAGRTAIVVELSLFDQESFRAAIRRAF